MDDHREEQPVDPRRKLADPERRRLLCKLLRQGVSLQKAAAACSISYRTLRNEIERDEEFAAQVERAKAIRVVTLTRRVYKHAKKDPRTALHLLACLDPQYAKNTAHPQQHVHAHAHIAIDPEQQRSAIAAIAAKLGFGEVFDGLPEPGKTAGHIEATGSSNGHPNPPGSNGHPAGPDAAAE